MKLSNRISQVGASATLAINARAKQLKDQGVDVVSFAAGEPDFDTPQFIKDAAKAALDAGDTKYNARSAAALKKAIADKLARENELTYAPDQIIVTMGGKQAVYQACQVLVDPGDKVAIPAPYWVSYPEMVKLAGGQPLVLPTTTESGFKITPQQVLDAAAAGAKAIILNSPSNPTGVTYTPAELMGIAQAVLKTDMLALSDEIYEKLVYEQAKFVSFAALDKRLPERTVTLNGLAKTYSMTGWRLGWAAGPKEIIGAMSRLMSHETSDTVSFAQAGALAAYTSPLAAETVERMRQEFQKRGRHMAQRLNAIKGVRCVEPTGAFYCFPDVSAHYGRTLGGVKVDGSLAFAKAALEQAKIAVVDGGSFGADNCIRLSFATSMQQIDKGLDRLAELVK
jgi:aspartate aminotransferase